MNGNELEENLLTVSLPHGAKALSANASVPKSVKGVYAAARRKQRAKKTARTLAWAETLRALAGRRVCPNRYLIRWYFWQGRAPDDDNVVSRCKAYLDGACLAMGMDDRVLRLRGVERVRDRESGHVLELVFWRAEGEEEEGNGTLMGKGEMGAS